MIVEICETLCKIVEVEAENDIEAIEEVKKEYEKGNIVMDWVTYEKVDYRVI